MPQPVKIPQPETARTWRSPTSFIALQLLLIYIQIQQASWVDSKGQATPIPGPGILLTMNSPVKGISLLDPPSSAPPKNGPHQLN